MLTATRLAASALFFQSALARASDRRILRRLLCVVVAALALNAVNCVAAQTSEWLWVSGSSTVPAADQGRPGVYGTLGTAAPANVPGGRQAPSTWTDGQGNLWLFGGYGSDSNGIAGYLNDIWEYSASTHQWAWMGGSSTVPSFQTGRPGIYGALGTAALSNVPGGRTLAAAWVDNSGEFWLSGGAGYDSTGTNGNLNDLWMFSPSLHEWTWLGGSNTVGIIGGRDGVYGTKGTADAANIPGGRNSATAVVGPTGDVYLFGGYGADIAGSVGYLDDLWMYSSLTHEWTWVGGSDTIAGAGTPVYGTKGTPAPGNLPGGRSGAFSWKDKSNNLWFFGGFGLAVSFQGRLNDLWEFNPSTTEWTWVGGSNAPSSTPNGVPGVYGALGIATAANVPGGRTSGVGWTDTNGDFILFGGQGIDSVGILGQLNDVWQFDPALNEWTWMDGSNVVPTAGSGQRGVYGALGTPAAGNTPGGRYIPTNWTDQSGRLWLFGGVGNDASSVNGIESDLWEYLPPVSIPVLSLAARSYTGPKTVTIADANAGASIYYTTDGTAPTTASSVYSAAITVSSSETVEAIATATGHTESGAAKATYSITPATPTIVWPNPAVIFYGTTLSGVLNAKATFNSNPVPGTFAYSATQTGGKAVAVTATTILGAGGYTLNVTFAPTDAAGYTGATGNVTLGISTVTPTISVVSSANPQLLNQPVTFTATVSNPVGTPTGTMTFYNVSTQLGQSTVANGLATYTMPMPSEGDLIQAMYSGDSNFTAASSIPFAQGFSDFGITPGAAGTAVTIPAGGQAAYQLVVAASGTGVAKLMSPLILAVRGLPIGATATFSPATAAAQSLITNVTLTINTPAAAAAVPPAKFPFNENRLPVASGAVLLIALGQIRQASLALRRRIAIVLLAIAGATAMLSLNACGGGSGASTTPPPVTHPQSFTLTVTGTEGPLSHTLSLTLNTF